MFRRIFTGTLVLFIISTSGTVAYTIPDDENTQLNINAPESEVITEGIFKVTYPQNNYITSEKTILLSIRAEEGTSIIVEVYSSNEQNKDGISMSDKKIIHEVTTESAIGTEEVEETSESEMNNELQSSSIEDVNKNEKASLDEDIETLKNEHNSDLVKENEEMDEGLSIDSLDQSGKNKLKNKEENVMDLTIEDSSTTNSAIEQSSKEVDNELLNDDVDNDVEKIEAELEDKTEDEQVEPKETLIIRTESTQVGELGLYNKEFELNAGKNKIVIYTQENGEMVKQDVRYVVVTGEEKAKEYLDKLKDPISVYNIDKNIKEDIFKKLETDDLE